ncbi:hypothetical protein MMC28_009412 [Mycoblastus sanguinarius]|nr:hypothetical protein [Mycoblastus sanguinarius]
MLFTFHNSDRPFSASLKGVHLDRDHEDLYLSTDFSFTASEDISERDLDLHSTDPSFYSLQSKQTPPLPSRKSWLPPLRFQLAPETDHPAVYLAPEQQPVTRSQTNLLPESINYLPLTHNAMEGTFNRPFVNRSRTTATTSSSVYSRSTSTSTLSRNPSTLSSFSSNSPGSSVWNSPPRTMASAGRPDVPPIPAKYRHPSHSLRNGGRPLRPGSRPPMPPADFWMYARAEQQKYPMSWQGGSTIRADLGNTPETYCLARTWDNSQLEERSSTFWSGVTPRGRPSGQSEDSQRRDSSMCRYPLLPASPERAALRPNQNKGNVKREGQRRSYESLRKGIRSAAAVDYGKFDGDRAKRRTSRTLVKKRQPWDQEPRREKKKMRGSLDI